MTIIKTNNSDETEAFGVLFGKKLLSVNKKYFIALYGDLGAGKTVFVRGLTSVLSPGSRVKSPTYTIVNEYRKGSVPLFHFDLYRISSSDELDGFGFDEYLENGICVAEWSENLGDMLPLNTIKVEIIKTGENERTIKIDGIDIE